MVKVPSLQPIATATDVDEPAESDGTVAYHEPFPIFTRTEFDPAVDPPVFEIEMWADDPS